MLCRKTFPLWWSFTINSSNVYSNKRWYHQDDFEKLVTCVGHVPSSGVHRGAAGAKKAAWTGANWKRIDFPPKFQLDLSSAHVYSTNPSFPPLALIGLQSFLLPLLLALTAFLNEPQKFSSISCKGKFSLGNDQVWPEISSADVIFRSAFSEIFSCIYKSKWFAFLLL